MSLSTQYSAEIQETTCCVRRFEKVTKSHMFRIEGYSIDKNIGKGNFLESSIFDVGGYNWSVKYYPNGTLGAEDDDISIYLYHKSKSEGTRAQVCFTILDQSGCAIPLLSQTGEIRHYETVDFAWGYKSFCKRRELESNIRDDCFVIKSVITVFKVFSVEPTPHIVVPPCNIQQQLGLLLENGNGADVTFEVDGQTFSAHKCILAVRSPVFSAQFFGPMKEKSDTIKIEEMEAPVFKALLHFIYNDIFPEFEEIKESAKLIIAQHLLIAADRYCLERLKIICEKMLCGSIDTNNAVSLLVIAERHSCNHLKATCLKFLASPRVLQEVWGPDSCKDVRPVGGWMLDTLKGEKCKELLAEDKGGLGTINETSLQIQQ